MENKNIALVGAGYWGKNLARSLSELGVLRSICDQAEEIREGMQKLYKDVSVTADFESSTRRMTSDQLASHMPHWKTVRVGGWGKADAVPLSSMKLT